MHSKHDNHQHGKKTPEDQTEGMDQPDTSASSPAEGQSAPAQAAGDAEIEAKADPLAEADYKVEPETAADPRSRIAELETLVGDLNDKFLRKAADFENLRKRSMKEKEEARLYATTELLVDLVSLLDDFDRAIQSSEAGKDWKNLHDGVSIIQKAFLGKLDSRYGLKRYDSAGEPFDPSRHEALMAEQREGLDSPVVVEDFMKGYILHDRIIRPAKVRVAMPAPSAAAQESQQTGDGASPSAAPDAPSQ